MLTSTYLYNTCAAAYTAGLFGYVFSLRKVATTIVSLGLIAQTLGMAFRWYEAGLVELEAYTQSTGEFLTGTSYWQVLTQHPPWSNLYEIMVYMGFGLVAVFLICEVKWRPKLVGIFALLLVLTTLGVASLTNGEIKPLVPALKSWWIMIHVISASVAYSAGTIAAITSLLYLIKSKELISLNQVASGMMGISALILFILGRGFTLFTTQTYQVKSEISPGVGWLMILATSLCLLSASLLTLSRSRDRKMYFIATLSTFLVLTLILVNQKINIWDLSLLGIIFCAQSFIGACLLWPNQIRKVIPEAAQLDHISYSNILAAFSLMAVVLVTGALWAHYAWGRYWGWDPKETGALVIWLNLALYLHARLKYKEPGPKCAVIAIAGFFIIIAGFLGVNLGWFADGLHSYGSS